MPKPLKYTLITLAWLLVWHAAALLVNNSILLCTPFEVAQTLLRRILWPEFWSVICFSLCRIVLGFILAFSIGILLGATAWRFKAVDAFLSPAILVIKSVPIVCFIVLLLIWFGAYSVSAIAVVLVVFPATYSAVLEGLSARDTKLAEMLKVYRVSGPRKVLALYWPSVLPFLVASSKVMVGMAWKSGVAAELIGIPLGSIGERIYQSKILLSSADLFAWTLVVIVAALLCEKGFLYLLRRSEQWSWKAALWRPAASRLARSRQATQHVQPAQDAQGASCTSLDALQPCSSMTEARPIIIKDLCKSFDNNAVIRGLSATLQPGACYALKAASGHGKTTVLSLIAGLILPSSGSVTKSDCMSMVFQEARLIENRSAVDNLRLVAGGSMSVDAIYTLLATLLPTDSLDIPVEQLSGGMRRRVEICRALAASSQVLLLDEPFAGLDAASKQQALEVLKAHRAGRTLVLATHDSYDIEALQAHTIELAAPHTPAH